MFKRLFSTLIIAGIFISVQANTTFADVIKSGTIQKQSQTDLYTQQIESLKQQNEYLHQQTEILRQQNEIIKQNQAYNQGYTDAQKTTHSEIYVHENYAPGIFVGGLCAGYVMGHLPYYRPYYYPHYCHRPW